MDFRTFVYLSLAIITPIFIIVEWIGDKYRKPIKIGFLIIWIILCVSSALQYSSDNSKMERQKDTIDSLNVIAKNSEVKLDSIHQAIIRLDKTKFSDLPLNEAMTLLSEEYMGLKKEIAKVEKKTNLPKYIVENIVCEPRKDGIGYILKLSPSNYITSGVMNFSVKLLENPNAVINMFETYKASKKSITKYTEDRRAASFYYYPSGYGFIRLHLILSELATFEISSEGYLEPTIVKQDNFLNVNQ